MTPTRLIAETALEYLARRLRFLGYDVVVVRGARLDELFAEARRLGRTVLTPSDRRPPRFAGVATITVPRDDPAAAVRRVAASCAPAGAPFSRCALCNAALQRRHALEAMGEVPGSVLRGASRLPYCPDCGKWYWEGSHTDRVREWLERALGRPLAPGGPGGDAG